MSDRDSPPRAHRGNEPPVGTWLAHVWWFGGHRVQRVTSEVRLYRDEEDGSHAWLTTADGRTTVYKAAQLVEEITQGNITVVPPHKTEYLRARAAAYALQENA